MSKIHKRHLSCYLSLDNDRGDCVDAVDTIHFDHLYYGFPSECLAWGDQVNALRTGRADTVIEDIHGT